MNTIHASVKNLNLWYDSKQVLSDINLDINRKEVLALIGASGCGKSTFLRCFNRMNDYIPNCKITGELKIDDLNIYGNDIDVVLLRAKVGMVFQKPNPFPKSIYDNVAYGPKLHGMADSKEKLDKIVEKSLKQVGLWDEVGEERLKDSALKLSGGQQQRLCIARAISIKPTMLLMDEPCSALDPIATNVIENLIRELKERFTIIIITHSLKQTRKLADKVAFFQSGKIVEVAPTKDIFESNDVRSSQIRKYIEEHL